MKLSEEGLKFLSTEEGFRTVAYQDSVGVWTIGVGHTGAEVHEGLVWSTDEVWAALHKDVEWAEEAVNEGVKVPLTQYQFDALVSFTFNVGAGAFARSTLLRKLNEGDFSGAAAEFMRWIIPNELIGRRRRERSLFEGGIPYYPLPYRRHVTTRQIQEALGVTVDGIFGPQTLAAVKAYQESHGLVVDGIVGPKTLDSMGLNLEVS